MLLRGGSSTQFGGRTGKFNKPDRKDIWEIIKYAVYAAGIALSVEVVIAIILSFWLFEPLAFYLSSNAQVSSIATMMWRTIDWTYVLFAVSIQLTTILLATWPAWFLLKSLASNILYVLPWAVAVTRINITAETA
ncbi:hypothetical protein HK102_001775, partial [Quaeritorhiza haematococci]